MDAAGAGMYTPQDLQRLALEATVDGVPGVLVRTLATAGFGPRPPLESLLILDDGRRAGSILGGRLDPSIDDAVTDLGPAGRQAVRVGISDVGSPGSCAGTAEVLAQRVDQLPARYWAPADPPDVAATLLDSPLGATMIVTADGACVGTLGDAVLDHETASAASALLRAARSTAQIVEVGPRRRRVLFEVRRRTATLVVAGGGELAVATAALAATLGWTVHASDDPAAVCAQLDRCGPGDAVVVMSHDPALDEVVLVHAATRELGYVGVLGSRRVHRIRHARLRRLGVSKEFIAGMHGPAGLDVGAWTPHETAVSIMAEILAVRTGRTGRPLTDVASPIHP